MVERQDEIDEGFSTGGADERFRSDDAFVPLPAHHAPAGLEQGPDRTFGEVQRRGPGLHLGIEGLRQLLVEARELACVENCYNRIVVGRSATETHRSRPPGFRGR